MSTKSPEVAKRKPDPCQSYRPGHHVHPIQSRLSREALQGRSARRGTLLRVGADGVFEVECGSEVLRLWHHNPRRLQRRIERGDTEVLLRPQSVMAITGSLFSVRDAGPDEEVTCGSDWPQD